MRNDLANDPAVKADPMLEQFVKIVTHHTIVERVNVERLRANAVEAAEQTERLSVPEVRAPGFTATRIVFMCFRTAGTGYERSRRRGRGVVPPDRRRDRRR